MRPLLNARASVATGARAPYRSALTLRHQRRAPVGIASALPTTVVMMII